MKKIVLLYAILSIYVAACSSKGGHETSSNKIQQCSTHVHLQSNEVIQVATASDESVFNLEAKWKNQKNQIVRLQDFAGKITVISMVYTHCQYACPRILQDMKAIEKDLHSRGIEDVNFVMVSIDPARDTPERLQAFYEENKLLSDWTLLTGDAESVMELAAVLGVRYKTIGKTDFSHSNLITILDFNGEIVHRQEGLGVDPSETVAFISGKL